MEMTIMVTGREPVPRVINVKQYSSGVDKIVFNFDKLPLQNAVCSVANEGYRQELALQNNSAQWLIPLDFTKNAGCFDIQLELTSGNQVWKSDNMLLIVSESVEGTATVRDSGGGIIGNPLICVNGITDEGVSGIYTDLSLTGYVPEGIPCAEGLTGWYDFTNYNGEARVLNPCIDSYNSRDMQIIGGTVGTNELVLQGTANSYAKVYVNYPKDNYTVYGVMKCGSVKNNGYIYGNSTSNKNYEGTFIYLPGGKPALAYHGTEDIILTQANVANYFVFAISGDNEGKINFYVDDDYGFTTKLPQPGNTITFGCDNNNGQNQNYYNGILKYKCLAVFEKAHTSAQIAENIAYLQNKFIAEVV